MPQIEPITEPKIKSVKRVLSKTNDPSKMENNKNAATTNEKPIKKPFKSPFVFVLPSPKKTPKKMDTPFITWLTGVMILSDTDENRKTNANSKIPTSATASPTNTPFVTLKTKPFCAFSFIFALQPLFIQQCMLFASAKRTFSQHISCQKKERYHKKSYEQ